MLVPFLPYSETRFNFYKWHHISCGKYFTLIIFVVPLAAPFDWFSIY